MNRKAFVIGVEFLILAIILILLAVFIFGRLSSLSVYDNNCYRSYNPNGCDKICVLSDDLTKTRCLSEEKVDGLVETKGCVTIADANSRLEDWCDG